MKTPVPVLAAALLQLPLAALAQTPASLAETVVTATRVPQPLTDVVADVSVIDSATIERSGATGVVDLLARLPGLEISRNGGVGNTSSVYIRGAESRFTAVYLDGVRIDSQSTGGADWEAIPLAQIDHIEVLRGPAAAVYGSDAIGGVIQLFTRRGEAGVSPYASIGFGSRNLVKPAAGVSGASGAFDYALGASHEQSTGFNVLPVPGYNPDKDGYTRSSGNARIGFQIDPRQRLDASVLSSYLNAGYDDYGYDPAAPVNDRTAYHLTTAGLTWSAQWTDVWHTRVSVTDSRNEFETRPDFYRTATHLRGYLFQNEFRSGPHLLTATLERREDTLDNAPGQGPYASPGLNKGRFQNGLALGYGFARGPHALQINVRHDDDSDFGGHDTGSVAYAYAISPSLRATASAATAFRAPTLYNLYSEYGVASLKPEQSRNVDLGLRYAAGDTHASIVAYRNRVRNLIQFDYNSTACASYFGCYGNVDRARYEGVTLSASQRIGAVALRGSVDWQNPRDLDSGKLLTRRSRVHGTLGIDWHAGAWTLGAEVQAAGRRYNDAANTQVLGGYGLVNLSASTKITADTTFIARVDNLANKKYQLVTHYATPGLTLYVGLKWAPHY